MRQGRHATRLCTRYGETTAMKSSKQKTSARNDVRLLPAVIGVGAILFGLKAGGLAFSASAADLPQTKAAPAQPATVSANPAPPKPASDPFAAINAALPMPANKPAAATNAPPPPAADNLPPELAGSGVTQAEMDVLTSLAGRRDTLDERQRELELKANVIAAAEKRVDEKIAQLKALQARIDAVMGQRDSKDAEQLDGLVRIYTAMKPKDAARIFSSLDDQVRIGVAGRMKADAMAGILAALPSEVAQKLTVELANRYKMLAPASAPAATPANAPAAPAPAPAAGPAQPPAPAAAR